jgi:hypothetical protein
MSFTFSSGYTKSIRNEIKFHPWFSPHISSNPVNKFLRWTRGRTPTHDCSVHTIYLVQLKWSGKPSVGVRPTESVNWHHLARSARPSNRNVNITATETTCQPRTPPNTTGWPARAWRGGNTSLTLSMNLSVCAGVSENQFMFRLNLIKAGIPEQR